MKVKAQTKKVKFDGDVVMNVNEHLGSFFFIFSIKFAFQSHGVMELKALKKSVGTKRFKYA